MEREEFEKLLILNGIKPKTHERISPEPAVTTPINLDSNIT